MLAAGGTQPNDFLLRVFGQAPFEGIGNWKDEQLADSEPLEGNTAILIGTHCHRWRHFHDCFEARCAGKAVLRSAVTIIDSRESCGRARIQQPAEVSNCSGRDIELLRQQVEGGEADLV